ncbi:unnamed protein product [Prorocentrum cordatum]|uniref:Uncharacterized protein n=1 Tax=Prorocentrum cordatum TaxID=2364126 RepID=A0ABN9T9Y4_9DINO|nr:unnamed protein product [Polarella glacialis]
MQGSGAGSSGRRAEIPPPPEQVFDLKGKRATPTSVTSAAVGSAKRGWRSVAEVAAWEDTLSSVTAEDVLAAHAESLSRLCDAANVVACVVCDPGSCAKTAKGFAAALGLPAAKVFVKENISDCFAMVDARVRGALDQLPA